MSRLKELMEEEENLKNKINEGALNVEKLKVKLNEIKKEKLQIMIEGGQRRL